MRLLVLADTEPSWASIPQAITTCHADALITAGDLSHTWLSSAHITDAPVPAVGVYGNHDTTPYLATFGIANLHLTHTTINGTTFIGLEGCVRYKSRGRDILYTQQEYAEMIADMPAADVLVTHCPPAGINDHPDPAHVGITALRDWIGTHKPALLIHGHTYPETPVRKYLSTRVEYVRGAADIVL
ncbi:hypothetical protein E3G68_005349 [Mycobacteroides abscessus]|uniref:metallophosphoesterase n=1 Tax=Mycobacteroides abscessus TaxID=36809 RepID=UPI0018786D27|nr:hypothetical protein [Mycobacteroides abscessus]